MTQTETSPSSRHVVASASSSSPVLVSEPPVRTKTGVVARGRGSLASITDVETALLTLTPALLGAIRGVAPKKPRSKIGYVIAFGIIAVVGALAADTSTREFGVAKGRAIAARLQGTPTPVAPPLAAPPVAAPVDVPAPAQVASLPSPPPVSLPDEPPAAPPVSVTRAKKAAKPAPAIQSKKSTSPRSAVRQSTQRSSLTLAANASPRES